MNFTERIRKDILHADTPKDRAGCLAMLAAFLDTSGAYRLGLSGERLAFSFTNESEEAAEYFLSLADRLFGISMTVTDAEFDHKQRKNKLTFSYFGNDAGDFSDETYDYCAHNLCHDVFLGVEECIFAYLKGAFLGSGSCTLPHDGAKTGYHLEFVFPDMKNAEAFCSMMERVQLLANIVVRSDRYVVYCKNRETISDFLAVIGAETALKQLTELSEARAVNNNDNRISNCVQGNADKAAIASAAQVFAIEKIMRDDLLEKLPPSLKEAAVARVQNPALSLTELAALLGVSKSCLNHRMRKLMEYGKQLI